MYLIGFGVGCGFGIGWGFGGLYGFFFFLFVNFEFFLVERDRMFGLDLLLFVKWDI